MTPSDRELIERVQAGDAGAFEALFAGYHAPLRRHLAAMVRDEAAADDLLQETFLRLWTRAEQWQDRGSVKGWLFRIATNLALNHLRTLRRRRQEPLDLAPDPRDEAGEGQAPAWLIDAAALGPEALAEQAERLALLGRLVDGLPADKRAVVRLVHGAALEIGEVADRLGIPPGTVKSRLHYATRRLAEAWHAVEAEWEE